MGIPLGLRHIAEWSRGIHRPIQPEGL